MLCLLGDKQKPLVSQAVNPAAFPKCHLPASHTALLLGGRVEPAPEHPLDEGVASQLPEGSWQSHFCTGQCNKLPANKESDSQTAAMGKKMVR